MLQHRLVAHRGFQRKYPENTLLSMREAIEAGALYLETDIQLTRDLQPVLYHDGYLARISGVEGFIQDLDLAAATALPACEPFRLGETFRTETVTSLDAFASLLQQYPAITAFIEIKEESLERCGIPTVFNAISRSLAAVKHQTVLISFDVEVIALARAQGFPRVGIVLKEWGQIDHPTTAAIGPDYLFTNVKLIPGEMDLSCINPLLVIYEIDRPEQAIELFNRGADMVETFDIGGMIEQLSSHAL